jgi:glycosyltransferase involved in cell wall biosynthesis
VRISIVIPAFNEERLLRGTLDQVKSATAAFARRQWETELIVCDNNSTDRTAEIAREAGAQVVFEPVNQIARARNRGAETASGDWLIFVDADSSPSPELFEDVAREIESKRCLAGGCTARMETNHLAARCVLMFWNCLSRTRKVFAGWMIFCETETFRALQGFNTVLYVSEDIDLSIRLRGHARRQGKKTVVLARHPLLTSSRKVKLYGMWKHLWLMMKIVFTRGKSLQDREACFMWYEGRR